MTGFEVGLTIDAGALHDHRDRIVRQGLRAAKAEIAQTSRAIEQELEALTRTAVGGALWKAWGSSVYPGGQRLARHPVGEIYFKGKEGTRSRGAITSLISSGRIRGRGAKGGLAIPLPAAGSRGRAKSLTPEEWEQRTGLKLRAVPRKKGGWLLVLDEAVLSGKGRVARLNTARRRATGRGNMTVPIFVVIPFVDFRQKFAVAPVVSRLGSGMSGRLVARLLAGG